MSLAIVSIVLPNVIIPIRDYVSRQVTLVEYLFVFDSLFAMALTGATILLEYKRGNDAEKEMEEQKRQKRRDDFLYRAFPISSSQ